MITRLITIRWMELPLDVHIVVLRVFGFLSFHHLCIIHPRSNPTVGFHTGMVYSREAILDVNEGLLAMAGGF